MSYYHGGQNKRYSNIDLDYGCSSKSLIITSPVDVSGTILPSVHYTSGDNTVFDTVPLQPAESHVNGLPNNGESQFFDEDALRLPILQTMTPSYKGPSG